MRRKGVILDDPIDSDSDSDTAAKSRPFKRQKASNPLPPARKPFENKEDPASTSVVVLSSDSEDEASKDETEVLSPFSLAKRNRKRRRKTRNDRKEIACPRCTYLNVYTAAKCAMCDGPLKQKKAPDGVKRASQETNSRPSRRKSVRKKSQSPPKVIPSKPNSTIVAGKKAPLREVKPREVASKNGSSGNSLASKRSVGVHKKVSRKAGKASSSQFFQAGSSGKARKSKGSRSIKSSTSWLDTYAPTDEAGLLKALNKRRVVEVKEWLLDKSPAKRVLILHGPPGSGKTTWWVVFSSLWA